MVTVAERVTKSGIDAFTDFAVARGIAEQTLDEGYPFPAEHRWWRDQARRHAQDVLALLDACDEAHERLQAGDPMGAKLTLGWERG
jgi:hypothetical protein